MRSVFSLALLAGLVAAQSASGQVKVQSLGATPTQAVIAIRNYTDSCVIELSESPTYAPVVPDVDPVLYPGSNVDTNRLDTITWSDGTRLVTLGHQTDDRALATATTYYLRVTGCGDTTTLVLATPTIRTGTTMQWPVPFNASKWGNLGYPSIDLLNPKTYVDPITGLKLRPLNLTRHWGYRTGGTQDATNPLVFTASDAFADWAGGTGWSNPAGVLNGNTSSATTSNTNPLDVYMPWNFDRDAPWNSYRTLDDLGLVVYGSGTASSAADRQIQLCIFLNPNSGCIGNPISVTLPQGTMAQVPSSGSDPDHPWPASFPTPLFAGWGINRPIGVEYRATTGTLSSSTGRLTIASVDWLQHFSDTLTFGNRIKIAGSGCLPNDMCTIATLVNAAVATTGEPVNVSNATFVAYGFGVRVTKATASGSVTVGLRYKIAGSRTVGVQAGVGSCSYVQVTSGDGKKGYVCDVNSPDYGTHWLYFIADDGTSRKFSGVIIPKHQAQFASMPSQDRVNPGLNVPIFPVGFDPSDGNVFYAAAPTVAGGISLFKLTYTGDYTQDLDFQYSAGVGGDAPDNYSGATDKIQWTNVMPPSQGKDLQSQITARFPNYNSAIYGNWSTGVGVTGISGGKAYFYKAYSGQDGGPGWIAVVDLPSGVVSNLIHTADGTGTNGYIRWGALHTTTAVQASPNTLAVINNVLNSNDTNRLHGGPFQASVTGVMRGGSWSTNTALPWPIDGSYDNVCPAGNPYEFMGATGNQCATLRLPRGGVCNIAPETIERTTWPCPWNPAYAQPFPLSVGAIMTEAGPGVDDEKFRIVALSTEADGQMKVVVQRNSMWDYCCVAGTHAANGVSNCAANPQQATHATNWSVRMYPPTLNGCSVGSFYINSTENQIAEVSGLLRAHGDLAAGIAPGNVSYLTSGVIKPDAPFSSLFALPTKLMVLDTPAFAGVHAESGVQSYISRINNNLTADPNAVPWMMDTNALNPGYGGPKENIGNSIGTRTLTPVSTNIYKIQVMGTLNYKLFPLVGWAGRFILKDVSGPASNLATAASYSVCYAYFAGECVGGSRAGDTYVKVPYVYDNGGCITGVSWANTPCVVSGIPGGGARQQAMYKPDTGGSLSRLLTYGFASPGQHYPFTAAGWITNGKTAVFPGSHLVNGWGNMGFVMVLPPWQEDTVPRNDVLQIPVNLPAGPQYAEIQFGYSRYGSPAQLFCTPRAEACNTSAAANVKPRFNFESEARTLTNCANGCTINMPVVAPNLVYFRVRRSADGMIWTNEDAQVQIVP